MATGIQNQESVFENLSKHLSLAVRNIQWSYAIFWSISATQPGVLNWGDGYYNGDIKTRKTVQAVELNCDQVNSQRSDQLRELYKSLAAGDSNPQARRPSAALSPEDLTDAEWYYLVCMSFVFSIGQELPGRTLANGQPIWLCNAHIADSKVFSRSLLAKSASIQTVVCFPFLGGVVELGVTELVSEDLSLIQHVKTSFLDIPYAIVPKKSNFIAENVTKSVDPFCPIRDHNIQDAELDPVVECEVLNMGSPDHSMSGFCPNQAGDSFLVEEIDGGASQVHSWQFMEEEFSNCVNSSDGISQSFVHPEKIVPLPKIEQINDHRLTDIQECTHTKLNSLDPRTDDMHYQSVLSAILTSDQLTLRPQFRNGKKESNFVKWKKGGLGTNFMPSGAQRLLKKVLFEVGRMHGNCLLKPRQDDTKQDGVWRPEVDNVDVNHELSERMQMGKLEERYSILRSLVPSKSKVDEISILDETIQYLKELERRVAAMESSKESSELEAMTTRKTQDTVEQTSDNYGTYKSPNGKKPLLNKRKASDMDEKEPENNRILSKDGSSDNVNVTIAGRTIKIELRCPWRECLLLEVMDVVSNLNLDSHSVQSSTSDGLLSVAIKSKFKGSTTPSVRRIRQALQRIILKCQGSSYLT